MTFNTRGRELVVFVTSGLPDPYVNCLTHAILNLGVESATVVLVTESGVSPNPTDAREATQILRVITEQLEALCQRKYLHRSSPVADPVVEPLLVDSSPECYRRVLDVLNSGGATAKAVPITDLYAYLRQKSRTNNCLFDVTGLRKGLLMDLAAALLALDNDKVHSFELKRAPRFDQTDLFHSLKLHEEYEYRSLLSSPVVRAAVKRLRHWTVQAKTLALTTLVLLAVGIVLLRAGREVQVIGYVSLISGVASIASWLAPFVRKRLN